MVIPTVEEILFSQKACAAEVLGSLDFWAKYEEVFRKVPPKQRATVGIRQWSHPTPKLVRSLH